MNSDDILKSLNKYKYEEFSTPFLNETIRYFKPNKVITKLNTNEYIAAGIKIHILYNDLYFYLTDRIINNTCYMKLNINKQYLKNIQKYLNNNGNICGTSKTILKKLLIISSYPIKTLDKIEQDVALSILGIESLNFVIHQKIDIYCDILNTSSKLFKKLNEYKKILSSLSKQERDRILLVDNIIFTFLGTMKSPELNVLIITKYGDDKLVNKFKKFNVVTLHEQHNSPNYHKMNWFKNKLPKILGINDIYTVLIDTRFHFNFMGLKCISIHANIEKSIDKSNNDSFIELYLLKIINNIDNLNELCIKNISFNNNDTILNNDEYIESMYKNIHDFIKKTYNIELTLDFIKKTYSKCSDKFETIYKNKISYIDPLIREQIKIHRKISQFYIMKYGKNKEYLIDMGSGKLSGADVYQRANIKNVYGIEPSIHSIQLAQNVMKRYKTKFTLINAFADKPISINVKFDIITFIFTIHYMINNINIVISNIKKLSKPNTIIIITCVNGDIIMDKIRKLKNYEIKYYNTVYWGAYTFNREGKILFYMKDVYGLEIGSEEYIVSITELINSFKKNKLELLYSNDFKSEYDNTPNAPKLHNFQYDILRLQQILVFKV